MSTIRFRFRAALVLGAVPVLLATTVATATAEPRPAPTNGPWPPATVLATDPATVTAPAATVGASTPCPAAPYGVRSAAPGTGKTVALTFDDGPGVTTAAILTILQRYGVPATFFNIGVNSAVRPTLVRSAAVTGLVLGNHTWDHPRLPDLSASGQASQLDRATAQQNSLTAVGPCLFRPPYGEYNATTLTLAQQRQLSVWNWSVDTEDWKAGTSTSSYWVERIVSRATAGGSQQHPVILMHNPPAGIPATVTALPRIIDYYRANGYTFVDLRGGPGRRAPATTAAATDGGLHQVIRTATGAVSFRTATESAWSGWRYLGGTIYNGPSAAAIGPTTTAVVATGTDNAVYRMTVTDAGEVGAWTRLGGTATSRPAVAMSPDGVEQVVVRGTDGQAYLRPRVDSGWAPWQALGGLLAPYAPGVAATADGSLTIAVVGTDRALYVRTRAPAGGWSAWRRVAATIDTDVALSPTADGSRLVAVVRNAAQNGLVAIGTADGTDWTAWQSIGGILASGPAVTVNGTALEVLTVGTDGRHYINTATDGTAVTGWTGWRRLPA